MTKMTNRKRVNPFVQIDKTMLSDTTISWKAKGILAYLLSKPDGWSTYATDIEKRSTDGRESVSNGLKELIAAGYLERSQSRNENGRFKGYEYNVYEYPVQLDSNENGFTENGKAVNGFPEDGKTDDGKPATSNNNLSDIDLSNKDFNNYNNNREDVNKTAFTFYEKNGFGILTPYIGEKMGAWIDDLNEELVIHAMSLSLENSVTSWSYTEKILQSWHSKKFTSVEQVMAAETKREQEKNRVGKKAYGPVREENIPEWFEKKKSEEQADSTRSDFDVDEERRKLLEELKADNKKKE